MNSTVETNARQRTHDLESSGIMARRTAQATISMLLARVDAGTTQAEEIAEYQSALFVMMHTLRQCREIADEERSTIPCNPETIITRAERAHDGTVRIAQRVNAMLQEYARADARALLRLEISATYPAPTYAPAAETERCSFIVEGYANSAIAAANRAEEHAGNAKQARATMDDLTIGDAAISAARHLGRAKLGTRDELSRVIDALESGALHAITAAHIARTHPDQRAVLKATQLTLAALQTIIGRVSDTVTHAGTAHEHPASNA